MDPKQARKTEIKISLGKKLAEWRGMIFHCISWADGFNHRLIFVDVERSSFLLWVLTYRSQKTTAKPPKKNNCLKKLDERPSDAQRQPKKNNRKNIFHEKKAVKILF